MRYFLAAAWIAMSFTMPASVQAGDNAIVVELYTSQGCSSCPPADALLSKLAERDDVIALALHVDYWDYIGWKDEFANPAYTKRQKVYARAAGTRTIYTPQMVVGGREHVVGNKPMELADAINAQRSVPVGADLTLQRDGARLLVAASPIKGAAVSGKMILQLVTYVPRKDVKITRGENAGRTITYSNIVTNWKVIGKWDGKGTKSVSVDLGTNKSPVAIILQVVDGGPVIAAAKLN